MPYRAKRKYLSQRGRAAIKIKFRREILLPTHPYFSQESALRWCTIIHGISGKEARRL